MMCMSEGIWNLVVVVEEKMPALSYKMMHCEAARDILVLSAAKG